MQSRIALMLTLLIAGCSAGTNSDEYLLYQKQPNVKHSSTSDSQNPSFQPLYSIGSTDDSGVILGNVSAITIDQRGHVYVADQGAVKILEFNADGEFVQEIGEKGRGPGEFQSITDLIVQKDKIYVWDAYARKIEVFSLDGSYVNQIEMPDANSGRMAEGPTDETITLLYSGDSDLFSSGYIAHVYNSQDFSKVATGIKQDDYYPLENNHQIAMSIDPGNIVFDINRLHYVTFPYNGMIYNYIAEGANISSDGDDISGSSVIYPAFQILEQDDPGKNKASIMGRTASGESISILLNNESKGMHLFSCGDSKCILHFYTELDGTKSNVKYDVIDTDSGLINTALVSTKEDAVYTKYQTASNGRLNLLAVSTSDPIPVVNVYQLKFQ